MLSALLRPLRIARRDYQLQAVEFPLMCTTRFPMLFQCNMLKLRSVVTLTNNYELIGVIGQNCDIIVTINIINS